MAFIELTKEEKPKLAIQTNTSLHYKKEDGSEEYYCEHSKFFGEVDPNVQNPKSIQRSANYKVYLLVKNRESKEDLLTLYEIMFIVFEETKKQMLLFLRDYITT